MNFKKFLKEDMTTLEAMKHLNEDLENDGQEVYDYVVDKLDSLIYGGNFDPNFVAKALEARGQYYDQNWCGDSDDSTDDDGLNAIEAAMDDLANALYNWLMYNAR